MTEWERTGNTAYRDKIIAGMKSIVALPNRIFTGPLALGLSLIHIYGRRCPLANDLIHFDVEGPAEWRGGCLLYTSRCV